MRIRRAAGGLLWRLDPAGRRLAIVHRPRKGDWSLPKGNLDGVEPWKTAALREVREETGCEASITRFAGATCYWTGSELKVVLYWHMAVVREGSLEPGEEIDEVAWLTPAAALSRLDHGSDRRLVARALRHGTFTPREAGTTRRVAAGAGAGVALAAGLAVAMSIASPVKRRAMVAGGATGLAGAAAAVLAAVASGRRRPR